MWWLVIALLASLVSSTCYNVTKPTIGGHWVVCDPIVLEGTIEPGKVVSDVRWSGNISNSSAWFYVPPRAGPGDAVYRISYLFQSWSEVAPAIDILYTRVYDSIGTDYETIYYPNGTNSKGTSFVVPPRGSAVFFRIWTLATDHAPLNIGGTTVTLGLGYPHVLDRNAPLEVDLAPGEWAFPAWSIHPVDHIDWIVFFQLEVQCGGRPLSVEAFVGGCGLFMCEYATTDISSLWHTKALGPTQYMLAYPNNFQQLYNSLLASLHNNNSVSCSVRAQAYTYYYPTFPVSASTPTYTSDPIDLAPRQYSLLTFAVQETSNYTVRLEAQGPTNGTLFGLFYHRYPYYFDANIVDATQSVVQENASSVIEMEVEGWAPYQPFAVYNLGSVKGTFKVTVRSKYPPLPDNLKWILVGSIVGGVVFVLVVGGTVFYCFRRASYVQLSDKS